MLFLQEHHSELKCREARHGLKHERSDLTHGTEQPRPHTEDLHSLPSSHTEDLHSLRSSHTEDLHSLSSSLVLSHTHWHSPLRFFMCCTVILRTVSLSSLRFIALHRGTTLDKSLMYAFILSRRLLSISLWFCLQRQGEHKKCTVPCTLKNAHEMRTYEMHVVLLIIQYEIALQRSQQNGCSYKPVAFKISPQS